MAEAIESLGVVELAAAIADGRIGALEATRHYLQRIERLDRDVHAYVHVASEDALRRAAEIDADREAGRPLGPLGGVPVAIKDNMCAVDEPTTCGSRILADYRPPYDATAVQRLRDAGAVLLGKTNMDEFAMGSSTETSVYGVTRNPWDLQRTPGGSSGGAAAAAAAGLAAGSFGSDTGGSVRQPGSYCGVTAIKPTYGRVSRYGLIAFASSLDQIGPLGRSVRDAARLLSVVAGHDPRDATSVDHPAEDYVDFCERPVAGVRVGVARQSIEDCEPHVRAAMEQSLARLLELGCELVDVELPHAAHGIASYYIVAPAEASSNLARFDGMRYGLRVAGEDLHDTYARTRGEGFGAEVKRRIMLGTYALSAGYYDAYYLKAQRVRTLIARDYARAFERCDAIVSPTAPDTAFKLGAKLDDPLSMYKEDIFSLPPSLAGLPALSTPCALSDAGLPVGMQLTGPALKEGLLVQLAAAHERAFGGVGTPEGY